LVAILNDAAINAKPTIYPNKRHGMYDGNMFGMNFPLGKMFCGDDRQRDGEEQVGQDKDLVETELGQYRSSLSLGQSRAARGRRRTSTRRAREFKENGEDC
jgi:hypothetical protein